MTTERDRAAFDIPALAGLYEADRADGSAIYTVSIQLIGIMVAYAAVGFAALGTDSIAWIVRGLIAIPLWGLAGYVVVNAGLHEARAKSIASLRDALIQNMVSHPDAQGKLTPDPGDLASDLGKVPRPLVAVHVMAYVAAFSGPVALSIACVASVREKPLWFALICCVLYLVAALITAFGYVSIWGKRFQELVGNRRRRREHVVDRPA